MFTQEASRDVNVSKNKIRGLTRGLYRQLGVGTSRNIKICDNNLDEYATYNDGKSNIIMYDSNGPTLNLTLRDNNVYSGAIQSRSYKWFTPSGVDYKSLSFGGNLSNFDFEDWRGSYVPVIYAGATPIGTQPTLYSARYSVDDGYATVDLVFNADMTGETGDIGVTLPIPADPESGSVTGGYSGGGMYLDWNGLTLSSGDSILGVFIDASDERLYIQKQNAGAVSRVDASESDALLRFRMKFQYKIDT